MNEILAQCGAPNTKAFFHICNMFMLPSITNDVQSYIKKIVLLCAMKSHTHVKHLNPTCTKQYIIECH